MTTSNPFDQVVLVDSQDQELGVMDKVEAHRGEAKLHRASSVFLFNSSGELLIQQRADVKIVGAGQWANSCCGNVRPGETYEECAHRRLREELGIDGIELQEVHKFEYHIQCNAEFSEWEMDVAFVGAYDGQVRPNPAEVQNYEWKLPQEVAAEMAADNFDINRPIAPTKYAPWFHLFVKEEPIKEMLAQ
jgi:isopentenyl-diphosphate Delta-isomerase